MMNWFRQRRLAKLRTRLEVVQAKWDHEMWFAHETGTYYPISLSLLVEKRVKLTSEIKRLEAKQP